MAVASRRISSTAKEARSRKLLSVLMAIVMAATLMIPRVAWADEPESATTPAKQDQTALEQGADGEAGDADALEQSTGSGQEQATSGQDQETERAIGSEEDVSAYAVPSQETEVSSKNGASYDGHPVTIGEKGYADLAAAAGAAQAGDTITLAIDQASEPVSLANNVTLDLGGNTLAIEGGTADTAYGVQFAGSGNNVLKNGTLLDERSNGNQTAGWKTVHVADKANLATENVAVKAYKPDTGSNYNYLIYVGGNGDTGAKALSLGAGTELSDLDNSSSTQETYGAVGVSLIGTTANAAAVTDKVALTIAEGVSINTMGYAIAGNGTYHGTEITIDGGTIASTDSAAIYHPQAGTLTLNGGTLEGTTGIQFCSGAGTVNTEFQFNGGTVKGVGVDERATKTGDGLVSDGAAISLVNRSYPGGMPSIAISGGTFTSAHNDAVLAYTWAKGASGAYEASDWAEAADKIAITGGTYSTDVSAYVSDEYACTQDGDLFTVSAMSMVAEIVGGGQYTSLAKAIDAAGPTDTVKLLDNVTQADGIEIAKDVAIDLNGKTFTVTDGSNINNRGIKLASGHLTIVNGTMVAEGQATGIDKSDESSGTGLFGMLRLEGGTLDMENVTLKNGRPWGLNVKLTGPATANLTNVVIESEYGGGIEVAHSEAEAVLDNCTFTQKNYFDWTSTCVSVSNGGKAIVNGGTYTSDGWALYVFSSGGTLEVSDGVFQGTQGVLRADLDDSSYPDGAVSVLLKGGDYTGSIERGAGGANESIVITGGTYSTDVSAYCGDDYECVRTGDRYVVNELPDVVEIGGTRYKSLAAAIEGASEGATLTMIDDVVIDASQIKMEAEGDSAFYVDLKGKTVALDLAGKAITFDLSKCAIEKRATATSKATDERGLVNVAAGAGLTVKDSGEGGIIEATSPMGETYSLLPLIQNYGSFTLESGTIKGAERVYYLATMYGSASETAVQGGVLDNQWGTETDGGICLSGNGTSTYAGYALSITGGTLKGGEQTLYLPSAGTTVISGDPVLEGTGRAIEIRAGELSIDGGTFVATAPRLQNATATSGGTGAYTGALVAVKHKGTSDKAYAGPVDVTISGGTFSNANGDAIAAKNEIVDEATAAANNIDMAISGGSFSGGINNGNLVGPAAQGVNTLSVSGGDYSVDPSAYVVDGKVSLPNDTLGYTVSDRKAPSETKPVVVDPEVDTEGADLGDKEQEVVDSVKKTEVEGLSAHANAAAEQLDDADVAAAKDALKQAISPDAPLGDPITVYVQAYLDIKPKAYLTDPATNAVTLTLDITPMARVVSSTATSVDDVVLDADAPNMNAVIVGEPQKLAVESTTIVSVPLPDGFVADEANPPSVYVNHVKDDGTVYIYSATLSKDDASGVWTATFANPNGFSELSLTTLDERAAKIGGTGYPTLQAAIDAVADGQTIELLKAGENATISKAVSFTLDDSNFAPGTITAASGYVLAVDSGVYTVTAVVPVASVTLDKSSLELTEGESAALVATVQPDGATDKTVTWTSSNEAAATVSPDGRVSAVKAGEATITATAGDKSATCLVTVVAKEAPKPPAAAKRLGGDDRYATMALISQASFPDAGSCSTVVIARGDNFPDALAAAGLAGVTGGQVLLTETSVLTPETEAEIKRLGATKAYVVGDENSVTARTFNEIKALTGSAERLGGADRIETALKIYQAGKGSWGSTALVATGEKAADSLSVSPIAYALKAPVFLAASDGSLSAAALEAIGKGGFTRVIVLGDQYSVSKSAFDKVKALVSGTERIGGDDRYATSQLTAEWALENCGFACSNVALTAGRDDKYADALVSSSLGGRNASPLLLVDDGATTCIDKVLVPNKAQVESAYVLGDKYTVSDELYAVIEKAVK